MQRAFKAIGRRFTVALLLMMSAASVQPSTRVMAFSDGNAEVSVEPRQSATLKSASASSPDIPFNDYDPQAEELLLELANQVRTQDGAPRRRRDAGSATAARAHTYAKIAAA